MLQELIARDGKANVDPSPSATKVRCREIEARDIDAIADLLTRGFPGRPRAYWMGGLRRQAARAVPNGFPRYGYLL